MSEMRIFCRVRSVFALAKHADTFNAKNPRQSDFSNKNVHFFAPYLHIFALISRVDFRQPKYVGRLKSTLLAIFTYFCTLLYTRVIVGLKPDLLALSRSRAKEYYLSGISNHIFQKD